MNQLLTFTLLNIANVVIQTFKSLYTIKGNKIQASLINALAYGLYTVVIIYTMIDINLWLKAGIVATANLVGVFIVKSIEEKKEKVSLWKIESTFNNQMVDLVLKDERVQFISKNYIEVGDFTIVNFYCKSKQESNFVLEVVKEYNGKFFVSASKL